MLDSLQDNEACPCAPPSICPNCLLAREIRKMHEEGSIDAAKDEVTQQYLEKMTDLQTKLLEKTKTLAAEVKQHEELAKQAAITLGKETSQANQLRNQMDHASILSMKTMSTIKQHPLHMNSQSSNIKVHQTGIKKTEMVNIQPEYAITLNVTDPEEDREIEQKLSQN